MDKKPIGKIRCYEKDDRRALAAILTANGYVVWQGREPRANKKATDYMVYFAEPKTDCPGYGKDG